MSAGKLASMSVPATSQTTVYTTADCIYADLTLNLVNTSASAITVKVYISTNATPSTADYVAYNQIIPANGGSLIFEDKLTPGERFIVEPTAAGLVARVSGVLYSKIA